MLELGDPAFIAEPLDAFVRFAEGTPLGVKGVAAVAGLVLLVAGRRLYRFAIMGPGILAGVFIAAALPLEPMVKAVAAVALAALGALAAHFLERAAIHAIGAILAAWLTWAIWHQVAVVPWWAPAVGGLFGLLLFPRVFKPVVAWLTALLGAMTLAWAMGQPQNLWIIGGLWVVGLVFQFGILKAKESGGS